MTAITLKPVGRIRAAEGAPFYIEIDEAFRPALLGLEGFSHIQALFWCDKCDQPEARALLQAPKPYKNGPALLGVFATRSPARPNPVGLSIAQVLEVDRERGLVRIDYIDADDQSPVLDLKPYTPSLDRVRELHPPQWCAHWPQWLEDSADFDWAGEFSF